MEWVSASRPCLVVGEDAPFGRGVSEEIEPIMMIFPDRCGFMILSASRLHRNTLVRLVSEPGPCSCEPPRGPARQHGPVDLGVVTAVDREGPVEQHATDRARGLVRGAERE